MRGSDRQSEGTGGCASVYCYWLVLCWTLCCVDGLTGSFSNLTGRRKEADTLVSPTPCSPLFPLGEIIPPTLRTHVVSGPGTIPFPPLPWGENKLYKILYWREGKNNSPNCSEKKEVKSQTVHVTPSHGTEGKEISSKYFH